MAETPSAALPDRFGLQFFFFPESTFKIGHERSLLTPNLLLSLHSPVEHEPSGHLMRLQQRDEVRVVSGLCRTFLSLKMCMCCLAKRSSCAFETLFPQMWFKYIKNPSIQPAAQQNRLAAAASQAGTLPLTLSSSPAHVPAASPRCSQLYPWESPLTLTRHFISLLQ